MRAHLADQPDPGAPGMELLTLQETIDVIKDIYLAKVNKGNWWRKVGGASLTHVTRPVWDRRGVG